MVKQVRLCVLREAQAGVAGRKSTAVSTGLLSPGAGVQQIHKARLAVWEQKPEAKGQREKVLLLRVLVLNFADSYYLTKVTFIRTLLLAGIFL